MKQGFVWRFDKEILTFLVKLSPEMPKPFCGVKIFKKSNKIKTLTLSVVIPGSMNGTGMTTLGASYFSVKLMTKIVKAYS